MFCGSHMQVVAAKHLLLDLQHVIVLLKCFIWFVHLLQHKSNPHYALSSVRMHSKHLLLDGHSLFIHLVSLSKLLLLAEDGSNVRFGAGHGQVVQAKGFDLDLE